MFKDKKQAAAKLIRQYAYNAEDMICGEWHLGAWPNCTEAVHGVNRHQVYFDILEALKVLAPRS